MRIKKELDINTGNGDFMPNTFDEYLHGDKYYTIILEVTRRCQLKCDHCLRGDAQRKDVSDKVIHFLSKYNIEHLTLTGGEPTIVRNMIKRLRQARLFPEAVWMCTNGYTFKKQWIEEFFSYANCLGDPGMCGLSVSCDSYHPRDSEKNYKKYSLLSEINGFRGYVSMHSQGYIQNPLYEGNCNYGSDLAETNDDGTLCLANTDTIYITVDGDVLFGCNFSYLRMKHLVLGNICEESLESIIERNKDTYLDRYKKSLAIPYEDL